MSIKPISGGYEVDCRPQGRSGKRYRKKFKTKGEAQQYERWLLATRNSKDWIENPKDTRRLSELIDVWYQRKGQTLKSGERNKKILIGIAQKIGNPKIYQITKKLISEYISQRVSSGKKPSTINRETALLSGVFTATIKSGDYTGTNPVSGLGKLRLPAKEMAFLTMSEIQKLLASLDGDMLKIAKICLATGARWGEAAHLRGSNVHNNKITFVDTKNGKNRTVPITTELYKEIKNSSNGQLFSVSYQDFYDEFKRLNFDLPSGQAMHVLRHTFASHFMMNGGNILTLRQILGHATIMQTMTYAHLAPDYLNEATTLNPLTTLRPN